MGLVADEVKAAVTGERFLALVAGLGGKPRKAGADWRCACFMHGGSGPNLVLTPSAGLWHCLSSCGGGDAIAMVMRALSLDFLPALEWLAEWAGVFPKSGETFAGACPHGSGSAPKGWAGSGPVAPVDGTDRRTHENARERPRAGHPAPETPTRPSVESGAFLADLWSRVAECCWSAPVACWLAEGRGIEPDAAYALGCRDWSTKRRELAELFDATPTDELEAVGFARDGRVHPAVLGCLRGDPEWAAVAVPIWRFGQAYPERWRSRLVTPRTTRDGGTVKSFGPYATGLPIDLLGAGRPARLDAPEVRTAHLGSGADGAGLVVLVEGEPDWWSATEVVDGGAVVLGVCGSPTRWREGWPDLADLHALGVRRVAVCVHHGPRSKGKDGRELGHGERFAEVVAGGCARAGLAVRQWLPAEGADLNDLHRAGRLRDWLAPLLEGATWATT